MPYLPQELIRKKRDGLALEADELRWLASAIGDGTLADAQVGALAMAMLLRGLSPAETASLTLGMRDSGRALRWEGLAGPVLDKHSTGGIGDKVSLALAPVVAACGGFVPMVSGRGLGHTGGTLDKLESIPGYRATPSIERFEAVVRRVGCAIIGQTDELAPADRRLYAVRDVTATVESTALITASILAKKLAAGLDALVMDVKVGSGAFLPGLPAARELAASIMGVAREAGLPCRALLTDMDQCLGRTAGNALEVGEALAMLRGEAVEERFAEVTRALAGEMLALGGLAATASEAEAMARRALASGRAAERFAAMVRELGGPSDLVERPAAHLPAAPIVLEIEAQHPGFITAVDARALGLAVVSLGGGRTRPDQPIDHAVGLSEVAGKGEAAGERPLALVHARDRAAAEAARRAVQAAFTIGERRVEPAPAVRETPG